MRRLRGKRRALVGGVAAGAVLVAAATVLTVRAGDGGQEAAA